MRPGGRVIGYNGPVGIGGLAHMSDDAIRSMLAEAALPPLLPTLAWLTGDDSLLTAASRPDPSLVREEQAGLNEAQRLAIIDTAVRTLVDIRDGRRQFLPPEERRSTQRAMEHCIGRPLEPDYAALMTEELAATGDDLRAPGWRLDDVAPGRRFRVAVIGSGMSGILAAHRLLQAGLDVIVIEKNDGIGGTWLENTYPGCRVDVANHLYSYSCAQRTDWPWYYSPQSELLQYFRDCAEKFGVAERVQLRTAVESAEWNGCEWVLACTDDSGARTIVADAVISAVGQLNRPKMPDIEGRDSFAGPSFHSARWDWSVDVTGKRVAVVGSAASATQLLPWVAERASHVDLYQRTPNWFVPVPNYHDPVPDGMRWLLETLPSYAQWYRFWLFWRGSEGLLPACTVDPGWTGGQRSVGAGNAELRQLLTMYLEFAFADRPDLLAKIVPEYAPAAKRLILDNGAWVSTLKRDNVELIVDGIDRIEPEGVVAGGELRPVDIVIHATGFEAAEFLTPMRIVGRDRVDLRAAWAGDARAYLGVTVPGFPNFFMLYGPNTNIVVNGSIIYFTECEVNYVVSCIEHLLRTGAAALEVTEESHRRHNEWIDAGNSTMVWGTATVNSWYRNRHGRSAQNWPYTLLDFWRLTRRVDPADYLVAPPA